MFRLSRRCREAHWCWRVWHRQRTQIEFSTGVNEEVTGASQAMGKSALGRLEISRGGGGAGWEGVCCSSHPHTPTAPPVSEFTPGPGSVLSPGWVSILAFSLPKATALAFYSLSVAFPLLNLSLCSIGIAKLTILNRSSSHWFFWSQDTVIMDMKWAAGWLGAPANERLLWPPQVFSLSFICCFLLPPAGI